MFRPEINLGIFQTHPETKDRVSYVKDILVEKGIEIDRRATTGYLKVNTKFILESSLWTGIIYIDDIMILNLSFSENEGIYHKILDASNNLDKYLAITLDPYEVNISVNGPVSTLLIGNNEIITLDDSETTFINKLSREVLSEMKDKIRRALWEFKLHLPF